jgi:DNA-binding MarR family transcriptional regulator
MSIYTYKSYNLSDRFVLIPPLLNLKDKKLKYTDALVYAALKSYSQDSPGLECWFDPKKDLNDMGCYPSYTTIAKKAGVARGTAIEAIKRLEKAKLIEVTRSGKVKASNHYWFPWEETTFTVPFGLFAAEDLTPNEKALLICIRQFYIGDELNCMFTQVVNEISKHLGIGYNTVYTQYNSLVEKGYVIDKTETYKKDYQRRIIQLSNKLNWIFKPKVVDYATIKLEFK